MSKFASLCFQYICHSSWEAFYNAVITEGIIRENIINIGLRYQFQRTTLEAIANALGM